MVGKIGTLGEIADRASECRENGEKIVLCLGTFDILHPGHYKHFEAAKQEGDVLIVALTSDEHVRERKGPGRPVFNQQMRAEVIAKDEDVDYVCISEFPSAIEAIEAIKPDVYIKGSDYKNREPKPWHRFPLEKQTVESFGGRVHFTDEITFSTTNLINNHLPVRSEEAKVFVEDFRERFSLQLIYDYLERISDVSVLIIGETIVDEYQYGNSLGKSGKSPTVAFNLSEIERYEGGVSAEYNHLCTFTDKIFVLTDRVVVKKRYIENSQKLFETYQFETPTMSEDAVCEYLENNACRYDVMLVSDFGHGMITTRVRDVIKRQSTLLVVNTQRNAGNMGYNTIRKYWNRKNDIFFCVDRDELMLAVCDYYDDINNLTDVLEKEFDSNIIVTSGDGGCVIGSKIIPSFATDIVDSIGAGDAFLSLIAPLVYLEAPQELIGFVGNIAGAIACSYAGNKYHVDKTKLCKFIETVLK